MSFSIAANAAEHAISENGNVFQEKWEKTWTGTGDQDGLKLNYGFNTLWYNEDFCSSYSSKGTHTAIVNVGNASDSESAGKNTWTKDAQVRHASGTVTWRIVY